MVGVWGGGVFVGLFVVCCCCWRVYGLFFFCSRWSCFGRVGGNIFFGLGVFVFMGVDELGGSSFVDCCGSICVLVVWVCYLVLGNICSLLWIFLVGLF